MISTAQLSAELVRTMPKIELHVHVEACISAENIERLARDADVPMLRPRDELFTYSSLAEFLAVYEWWCDLLRSTEIAEQVAYDAAVQMSSDGIVYADVLTGPRYWTHLEFGPLIEALGKGFDRAHNDGFADCRIVPSISREQSAEWALGLVEWIAKARPKRVVGLGLDGNEQITGRTCPKFEAAYDRAAEIGLGRTVHSGESSGPEGVWDALKYLRVDRIDHGVRAIEDAALVERLAADQVTLNICPTSNVITGLYENTAENPIGKFIEAGVPVTVNSDDPQAMNVSIIDEIMRVGADLDWTLTDAVGVMRNAIDAAFCDEHDAQQLHRKIDAFMESSAATTVERPA
jgi:adenosine deaminase